MTIYESLPTCIIHVHTVNVHVHVFINFLNFNMYIAHCPCTCTCTYMTCFFLIIRFRITLSNIERPCGDDCMQCVHESQGSRRSVTVVSWCGGKMILAFVYIPAAQSVQRCVAL